MAKSATKLAADIETPETPVAPIGSMPETPAGTNVPITFETYLEKARFYGAAKADGDDSLAMFAIDLVDGGKRGLIDPRTETERTKAKLDDKTDQVERLFSEYVTARGLKAVHERKDMANKSGQLRNFVKLGALDVSKGEVDGPSIIDEVKSTYKTTLERTTDKKERAKYNDAFNTYLTAAKKQLETPKKALDAAQIEACFHKPPPKRTPSVSTQWTKIAKLAKALTDGSFKLPDGNVVCDKSQDGIDMAAKIVAYAADIAEQTAIQEAADKAAALQLERDARKAATLETA